MLECLWSRTTALSNLVVGNQANKNALRAAGGIERLVPMLHANGEAAMAATEALGNLAVKNNANKDAVRVSGGIVALAELFKAAKSTEKAIEKAAAADAKVPTAAALSGRKAGTDPTSANGKHSGSVGDGGGAKPATAADAASKAADAASMACTTRQGQRPPRVPSPAGLRPPGATSPAPTLEISCERTAWALRNLTAANGLNSAALVAAGVTLKEVEPSKGERKLMTKDKDKEAHDKSTADKVSPTGAPLRSPPVPPPPAAAPLLSAVIATAPTPSAAARDTTATPRTARGSTKTPRKEAKGAPASSGGGSTGGSTGGSPPTRLQGRAPPPLAIESKPGRAADKVEVIGPSKGQRSARGPASAGVGLTMWARTGRA